MITTGVAFVATRARERLWEDEEVHTTAMVLIGLCVALVACVSLLGVFVNKVAPVQ
jgi:Co/Zn/Cd efflux system component